MPESPVLIGALRASHDRFAALVAPLGAAELTEPSYDTEWSIADLASHLGSQAEIFELFLEAGLTGVPAPGGEVFGPIWDRWNALPPARQVSDSVAANERFVARLEQLPGGEREAFAMSLFGRQLDLAGLLAMRLGEHALHVWDLAVVLDGAATLAPDAVDLLIDTVGDTASRGGKPAIDVGTLTIATTDPSRRFTLTVAEAVALTADDAAAEPSATDLELPAEALLRLVSGRLDPAHTPAGADEARLSVLRPVFPGF